MADKTLEGRLVLTGEDRTSKMWASATRGLKGFSDRARALSGAFGLPKVARAMTDIGRAAARTSRALSPLLTAVSTLTGIAAAGGVTALAAGLKASAERIDDMAKKARQLGVSIQTLRQFAYIAELQGVSWDQASEALTRAAKGYAEVRMGVGRMATQLEKISPKLADQIRKATSTAEAWEVMIGAIRNAKSEAEKIKLAELFFGTAEFTKIAELSQEQARALIAEFDKLAGRITDKQSAGIEAWNDSLTRLGTAMRGISDAAAVASLTKLQPFIDSMTKLLSENRDKIAAAIADSLVKIANAVASVDWMAFGASLASLIGHADALATAFGGWSNVMIGVAAIPFIPLAAAITNLGIALATTPAGITLAALALLTYEAFKHWQDIEAWFARMAKSNGLLEFFSELASGVTKAVDSIGADLKRLEAMVLPEWLINLTPSAIGERIGKSLWPAGRGLPDGLDEKFGANRGERDKVRGGPPAGPDAFHRAYPGGAYGGPGDAKRWPGDRRAAGGPVRAGGMSLVGERGPELVSWGSDGTVIDAATTRSLSSPAAADRAGRVFARHVVPPINRLNATMEELVRAIGGGWQPGGGGGSSGGGGGGGGSGGGGSGGSYQGIGAGLSAPPIWSQTKAAPTAVAGAYSGGPNKRANSWMTFAMAKLGLTKQQAAGMVAGMMGESGEGLNPGAIGDGGTSIGTAQWHGERARALKRFAADRGTDWKDVGTQQEFLKHELQTSESGTMRMLKRARTAMDALNAWVRVFERPAHPDRDVARRSSYLPELMRGNFTPATKAGSPSAGLSAPQTVSIGKGELQISIKTKGPGTVTGIRSQSPENLAVTAGVDKTGQRGWHPNRGQL